MNTRTPAPPRQSQRLGVMHRTLTGAAVLGVLFLLCWATEAIADIPVSKAFPELFMPSALSSPRAPAEGFLGILLLSALIGAPIAFWFNVFAGARRR